MLLRGLRASLRSAPLRHRTHSTLNAVALRRVARPPVRVATSPAVTASAAATARAFATALSAAGSAHAPPPSRVLSRRDSSLSSSLPSALLARPMSSAPATAAASAALDSKEVITPVKSAQDKRSYRVITLPNRLQAVLVSDPETDKAAAAMDVNVGHLSDPDVAPGLAHFLEHMLFLGTEKYPDENSYSAYLNAHGGHSNAYTGMENTNYYFDVTHEHLEGALDRFAQFFTAPLFTASATDREMNAVHNENAKNLQSDMWRLFQLAKSTANPKHPFSKFGTGNLDTLRDTPKKLGVDTRAELIKFHAQYYSANRMKLAVVGRETLDQLQALVTDKFGAIKNHNRNAPAFGADAFAPENMQRVYRIVPVMDLREISIVWQWPTVRPHYRIKPASAVAHLLGHEGEGSVLALLKRKGWANALSAGLNQSTSAFSAMMCSIELTEAGAKKTHEIIQIVYSYIALMLAAPEAEWRRHYQEQADVQAMNFRFKSTEHPSSYASGLAVSLGDYEAPDVLSGGWIYEKFDYALIHSFVKSLTPENSRIHWLSQEFKGQTDKTERWYGTQYSETPYTAAEVKDWTDAARRIPELFLPKPNPFIATDFTLRPVPEGDSKYPVLVKKAGDGNAAPAAAAEAKGAKSGAAPPPEAKGAKSVAAAEGKLGAAAAAAAVGAALVDTSNAVPGVRLFHKVDNVFRKPKANIVVDLVSPLAFSSPSTTMMTSLYCKLLEDSLNEFAYDAECAGLSYQLNNTLTGASLIFRGYSHKLPVLVRAILTRMRDLTIDPQRFALIREQVERGIRNFDLGQPYSHAAYEVGLFTDHKAWSNAERLAAVQAITPADIKEHVPRLLSAMNLEMLVHGNFDAAEAVATAQQIRETLQVKPLFPSQVPEQRVVRLADGTRYVRRMADFNPSDPNSCVVAMWQIGEDTPAAAAVLGVMAHLASEPCFNQLRTIETLGYLVWSGVVCTKGVLWYRVIVQSSEFAADHLDGRVEAFVEQFHAILRDMPAAEFAKNLSAVIAQKLEKDKTLNEESNRHWQEIAKHRYTFNRVDLEVDVLKRLTQAEVLEFFAKYIRCGAPLRRKLVVQVFGNKHAYAAGLSATPPPPAPAKDVAAAAGAGAGASAGAGEEDGDDEEPNTTAAEKPKDDKAKAPAEMKPLPPVPVDPAPVVPLESYIAFKKSMPLFPDFV